MAAAIASAGLIVSSVHQSTARPCCQRSSSSCAHHPSTINMSLVSPLPGAYAVVTLDPRISLKLVGVSDDPIVEEECRKMVCGKYIACITKVRHTSNTLVSSTKRTQPSHVFDLLRKQCIFDFDFVVQGLLPDDPATFYHHSMSVPIAPNTSHPTGRRTIQAYPPLPWNDCYHTHPFHLKGRCAIGTSRDYPESCLTVSEAELLACFLENDDNHVYFQEEARDAGNPLSVSPVPDLSPHLQLLIRMANKRPPITRPWWQKIIEHQMTSIDTALGEAKAPDSDTDVNTNTTHAASITPDMNNDTASTPDANTASDSGSGLHTDTTSDTSVAPDAGVAPTACAEDLDLAELLYMQFSPPSKELLPFVRFTYDLSSFESPPHPSGFLREVEELKRYAAISFTVIESLTSRPQDISGSSGSSPR